MQQSTILGPFITELPYILESNPQAPESNPHLVFATFLNEKKKLVHWLYHFFSKIQL
jgi:hypothetical protein